MHFSRLTPITILAACLLSTVLGVDNQVNDNLPKCKTGDGSGKRWYSELEIPGRFGPGPYNNYYTAFLKKKLANHDVLFDMYVWYYGAANINIQNGHGKNQNYLVKFKDANNGVIKSYTFLSNSGECQTEDGMVPIDKVKHITVQMENRW